MNPVAAVALWVLGAFAVVYAVLAGWLVAVVLVHRRPTITVIEAVQDYMDDHPDDPNVVGFRAATAELAIIAEELKPIFGELERQAQAAHDRAKCDAIEQQWRADSRRHHPSNPDQP